MPKNQKSVFLEKTNHKLTKNYTFREDLAVIFDLEFTSWPGSLERNWSLANECKDIIQMGAVKIETIGNLKEVSCFELLVKPIKNPTLSEYIKNFTGITQEKIEKDGVLFPLALSHFIKFIGEKPIDIMSNGGDEKVIEENCRIHDITFPSILKKSTDLKFYFSENLNMSQKHYTSAMLPELFGLSNHEKQHDALGDARSIAQVLRFLFLKKI